MLTIYNSSIKHCLSAIGGGISLYETNMLVTDSYLQYNKAYFGGSIALLNERNNHYYFYANLTDSVISDNLGIKNNNNYGIAGAIYLKSYHWYYGRLVVIRSRGRNYINHISFYNKMNYSSNISNGT